MALLPANLDYTDKDFESIRLRLFQLLESAFPEWTDRSVASFGNILVDLFSHVGDILTFYQDNQANEPFIAHAQLRRSMLAIAKLLAYTPSGRSAATVDQLFQLAAVPANNVLIEAGTEISTRDVSGAVTFRLLADLTIPAGTNPPQAFATIENSEAQVESFASTGLADQVVQLNAIPFVDASTIVVAANGAYQQVVSLLNSEPSDRHYVVEIDENDRASIRFGNGLNGEIPAGTITIDYKTGGGKAGNVEVGTLVVPNGSFTDVLSNPVTLTTTNPEKASGGFDRETIEQIRAQAPASLRVNTRTVALEDYSIGAEEINGVARALMLTSDQQPGLPENRGYLYVIPEGGGLPSDQLKQDVITRVTVTRPNTITFKVFAKDPIYKLVDVVARVYFKKGISPALGKSQIVSALTNHFAITNPDGTKNPAVDFGANLMANDGTPSPEIPLSDVVGVIEPLSSVRKVGDAPQDLTLNGAHEDLALLLYEFPVLNSVTVIDGDTGEVL